MLVRNFIAMATVAMMMLIFTGCGGTNNIGVDDTPDREAARFGLNVLDESFVDGSSAGGFDLSVEDYGRDIVVSVNVTDAQNLKALYFEMDYDAETYRPLAGNPSSDLADREDMINMHYAGERGSLQYGQVLTNFEWRSGFSGSGEVATILFRKTETPNFRTVSAAPTSDRSVAKLLEPTNPGELTWFYGNQGDYDQNSLVGISDLTPLGANFNASVDGGDETALWQIDGDGNGLLTIADLTPIGANFGRAAASWNVYSDLDAGVDVDSLTAIGNVVHGDSVGTPSTDRLSFSFTDAANTGAEYYWVRAVDGGGALGIIAGPVGGDPADQPTIALTNPPGSGSGTQADRYIANDTTDYVFTLTDPVDGDVTADAATTWSVTPPNADGTGGTFATTGVLNIDDAFEGDFRVNAVYDGKPNRSDTTVYMNIPMTGGGGDLFIMPDSADTDWDGSPSGDGTTEETAYVLHETGGFNDTTDGNGNYSIEFSLVANTESDGSGDSIDVNTLDWFVDGELPFNVFWVDDPPAGTFQVNNFTTSQFPIRAEDGESNQSNPLYVVSSGLPSS